MYAYLGWEQEFFVVSAELYKKRPDLVNAGRTLFGRLPPRHQSGDLNYFGATPGPVEDLLIAVQTEMMRCLLYTSPSPRDKRQSRMPSSA